MKPHDWHRATAEYDRNEGPLIRREMAAWERERMRLARAYYEGFAQAMRDGGYGRTVGRWQDLTPDQQWRYYERASTAVEQD